eukprot:1191813-Prorocentrum_minimum.AAC.2
MSSRRYFANANWSYWRFYLGLHFLVDCKKAWRGWYARFIGVVGDRAGADVDVGLAVGLKDVDIFEPYTQRAPHQRPHQRDHLRGWTPPMTMVVSKIGDRGLFYRAECARDGVHAANSNHVMDGMSRSGLSAQIMEFGLELTHDSTVQASRKKPKDPHLRGVAGVRREPPRVAPVEPRQLAQQPPLVRVLHARWRPAGEQVALPRGGQLLRQRRLRLAQHPRLQMRVHRRPHPPVPLPTLPLTPPRRLVALRVPENTVARMSAGIFSRRANLTQEV